MASNVITDIESKTKATSMFKLSDVFFCVGYFLVAYMFRGYVNIILQIPYLIFSILCAIFLVLPSKSNQGRNNLAGLFIFLKKDESVYRPFIEKEVKNNGQNVAR